MSVTFRSYKNNTLYGDDYNNVRNFLISLDSHNYPYGRWDWMMMHICGRWEWVDSDGLEKIGLWEESGKIAAIATYDCRLGSAYLLTLGGFEYLKEEMFLYARGNLAKDGMLRVLIAEGDTAAQAAAARNGLFPGQEKECDAIFPIDTGKIQYTLPRRFRITSMKDDFDIYKYGQVMWKGFNHEMKEEGPFYLYWEKKCERYKEQWNRPNIDLCLKIFAVAPNGDFVSHCGMWYDKKSKSALVEPVATEPAYRKMGLGKAVVLEGIKRCGELGAERAFVGSSQQFYYNIGFRPYATSTWWKEK